MNDITLTNGETFELAINFMQLITFKSSIKDEYTKFNNIVINGPKDIFDMTRLVYGCYLMNSTTKTLSYDGFLNAFPEELQSIGTLNKISSQIINGRKSKKIETLLQS